MLEELAQAGIPDNKIRFVASSGCHAAMNRMDFAKKLGESVMARFPVYNHNIYENCTYVGTTSRGTAVSINAEVMNCDFKVAINMTSPHFLAMYSGGAKMIIPGVAHIDTVVANHSLPPTERTADGQEIYPAYLDMEEAAKLAGLDITIECIINSWGDTVAIFAGALIPTHQASSQEARSHYLTPEARDKDIVIANAFTKANEWPLAMKATVSLSERGGDLVLIGNSPEGLVVHYLSGWFGKTVGGRMPKMFQGTPSINRLIVYSEYPDIVSMQVFENSLNPILMSSWDDVLKALQEVHGDNATVAIYPNADIAYFEGTKSIYH